MAGRNNIATIAKAFEFDGRYQYCFYTKPNIASPGAGGRVVDTSMSSGQPKYNAYVGIQLAATQLIGSGNDGIFTGPAPEAGYNKHLMTWGTRLISPATVCHFVLADYLLFYPLIDLDSIDTQEFDNTASLPRYTSGVGVQAFLNCAVQSSANATATLVYVDDGDIQRTTTFRVLTGTTNMVINGGGTASTQRFIPLASGSKGIKRAVSFTLNAAAGGFANLVLCKPLATNQSYETATHTEVSFVTDKLTIPKIEDGAYLNILAQTMASGAINIQGELLIVQLPSQATETIAPDPELPPFSFVPSDFGGLEFWLKADAGLTESAGVVTAWNDQSGNSRNPTIQGAPSYSSAGLNGKPTVTLDGSDDWIQLTTALTLSLAGKSAMEMIVVLRRNNSSRLDPLIDLSIDATGSLVYHDIPSNDFLRVGGRSDLIDTFFEKADSVGFVEDNFELISMIVNVGTDRLKYYLNNAQRFSDANAFNSSVFATSTGTQNGLFAYFDGSATAAITVAEVMIYSAELSDTDKDKIAWYINEKYNMGLGYLIADPSL